MDLKIRCVGCSAQVMNPQLNWRLEVYEGFFQERGIKTGKKVHTVNASVPSTAKEHQLETIFLSEDNKPLSGWTKIIQNGYVKRVTDEDVLGGVLEISGTPEATYIASPEKLGDSLGIRKRWISLIVKPIRQASSFKFQVQCLDSVGIKRVFRFDTRCTHSKVQYHFADVPFMWKAGWNNLDVDLKMLMRKAYCTDLSEVVRVHIHGNCRLRRVFFSEVYIGDEALPRDYKLISAHKEFKSRLLKEVTAN